MNKNSSVTKNKSDFATTSEPKKESTEKVLTESVVETVASPFIGVIVGIAYHASIGIAFGEMQIRDLTKHPYHTTHGEYTRTLTRHGKRQNLKLGINILPNKISGLELNAVFKPIPIIGIDASYIHFSEKNRTTTENLDIISATANFYRVREKHISLWWGLGATHVGNEVNKFGFTYQLGTDIYPIKPISLHLSYKQSFINQSNLDVFKIQGKYHLKNKTFFVGYHHFNLASEKISTPSLGLEIFF